MADKTPDEKPEETLPAQPTDSKAKRRLRPAPTVREQSEKAAARADRPRRRGVIGKVLGAPFRLIARIFRPLGRFKVFRIIGYIFVPPFFRNAWKELRLVTWPDFRQTRDLTFAVLIFSIIFGAIVAVTDYGLDKVFRKVILNQ